MSCQWDNNSSDVQTIVNILTTCPNLPTTSISKKVNDINSSLSQHHISDAEWTSNVKPGGFGWTWLELWFRMLFWGILKNSFFLTSVLLKAFYQLFPSECIVEGGSKLVIYFWFRTSPCNINTNIIEHTFSQEDYDCSSEEYISDITLEDYSNKKLEFTFWLKKIDIFKHPSFVSLSDNYKKSLFEMVEKNLHLTNSINFKQDANFKQTHSKSFMKFLNEKIKDNSSSLVEKLNLSEFVSNAQTELELPSSSSTSLALYNAVLNSVDWWTDLLNLFVDFVNSLNEYSQTSKIDRILECEFDAKKFNRLLGDALNYATGGEIDPDFPDRLKEPVVERNDQIYIDLNPDGQVSLDWDGGLPASVNHRHYNFKKFLCFLRDSENNKFFTSEEFKRLFKQVFIPGEEI